MSESELNRCSLHQPIINPAEAGFIEGFGRRPTLPPGVPGSTIGASGLNFCVRDGNRWIPAAMATQNLISMNHPEQSAGRVTDENKVVVQVVGQYYAAYGGN